MALVSHTDMLRHVKKTYSTVIDTVCGITFSGLDWAEHTLVIIIGQASYSQTSKINLIHELRPFFAVILIQ